MKRLISTKLTQGFVWEIGDPKKGFDSGAQGTYTAPVRIPTNAIITAIWCNITTRFTSATSSATLDVGTGLSTNYFNTATIGITLLPFNQFVSMASGNNLMLGKQSSGASVFVSHVCSTNMDSSQQITLTIGVEDLTAGAARFDIEYYYPQ